MATEILIGAVVLILAVVLMAIIFVAQKFRRVKSDLTRREEDAKHKMYEIAILDELGDRVGYSLNVQNVIEIIIGSLRQFMDYSLVSYILLLPEKMIFKAYLEKPVSRKFVDQVKGKMIDSMSAMLISDFRNTEIEETLWGVALGNESRDSLGSFFNIPLSISGRVVGLLTVADSQSGFYKEKEMTILYKIAQKSAMAVTRLQTVVEAEKSKLNAMVASMTEGVIMTDMDYRVIVVNPAARKALGKEYEKDPSLQDLASGFNGKFDLRDKIEESVRLDNVFISEEIQLPTGFFQIAVSPVKDNWKLLGGVVVLRDITREKEVERIKEDFTSMIVHELRSPLDSIKKMIEMMRASSIKKAKQEEYFQMIYGSSSDMLELIGNLLDVAKIEAGKFELVKQPSDIKKIIQSRVLFFDIAAKDAKIKISSCLGKDIPDKVDFDPHTVSQVLNNLISNALKFNKENGTVEIQTLRHKYGESLLQEAKDSNISWFIKKDILYIPDSLFVAVTNTGAGIAPEQISKLFNKFIQVRTVFAEKAGTGLGLAITKSIVESHGGIVGVESTQGQGATFYFSLPLRPEGSTVAAPVKAKT